MESFRIYTSLADAIVPMSVTQAGSITEDDLFDFEVSFAQGEIRICSMLTLDVSRWYPPMYLGEPEPPVHQPEVFVFCHDGQFNYQQAHAIGESIMRYLDREVNDPSLTVPDLFNSAD